MKIQSIALVLLVCFVALSFSSCEYISNIIGNFSDVIEDNDQNIHTHDYSVKSTESIYQKSKATCDEPAIYYLSCSCGERGEETFTDGEALGHVLTRADCGESMYCSVCNLTSNKRTEHIWSVAEDGKSKSCSSCGVFVNLDEHIHSWIDATCTSPKTCSVCLATEGETLMHVWQDATCTAPKTCSVCSATEGDTLQHTWQDATCSTPKTCSVCSTTEGSPLQHEWQEATCQELKKCLLCGVTDGELGGHNFVNNSCTICGYLEKTIYTVKVVSAGGMPISGVLVYVHNVEEYGICTVPTETDSNGVAEFTLDTSDEYSIELQGAPDGYAVKGGMTKDDRYPVNEAYTEIVLYSAPITTGGLKSSYNLGDVMYDFTLTDVNGVQYNLSTLLETKEMVMLNFWFAECNPCFREFPYINSVYSEYKDSIEILAINDYNDVNTIKQYPLRFTDGLDFPLFAMNSLNLSKFPSYGYPTTVIIDRYGVVCLIEIGAMVDEESWVKIFEHFTGDDYEQKLITSVDLL